MSQKLSDWWKTSIFYQIYPRSFYDANGDGIGDIDGIIQKLSYLKDLGIQAIWISPIFPSPMKDFGYDISDYKNIDPIFGSLKNFDNLIDAAHKKGLKILLDLVLSHTSTEHPWFKESKKNKKNPKADWYVWADARTDGTPPNNWLSVFGGSAWKWNPHRGQYYLHNFLSSQADLNFHNPKVQESVLDITKFWLNKGVDGFRLDTVNMYFHDKKLRNNPPRPPEKHLDVGVFPSNPYAFQYHTYDKSRPENLDFLKKLRNLANDYPETVLIGEISDDDSVGRACEYVKDNNKLHMAYNFNLLHEKFSASHLKETIEEVERQIGDGCPCWSFGNHDTVRAITRFSPPKELKPHMAKLLCALLLSLRGSPIIYQGEELGLEEANLQLKDIKDPYGRAFYPEFKGRDGCRTPLPWSKNTKNAGFGTAAKNTRTWLPIPKNHLVAAIDAQENIPNSILQTYKTLCHFYKKNIPLQLGSIQNITAAKNILSFTRIYKNDYRFCFFNCGIHTEDVKVSSQDVSSFIKEEAHFNKKTQLLTLKPYGFFIGSENLDSK